MFRRRVQILFVVILTLAVLAEVARAQSKL
jgi:hypothetical protein